MDPQMGLQKPCNDNTQSSVLGFSIVKMRAQAQAKASKNP